MFKKIISKFLNIYFKNLYMKLSIEAKLKYLNIYYVWYSFQNELMIQISWYTYVTQKKNLFL